MNPQNDRQIYKQVLQNRVANLKRKLQTATGYARQRLLEELQATQRLLKDRE